jgi:hypothetical protein
MAETSNKNEADPEVASIAIENAFVFVHNPELDYYLFTGKFIADSGASIHLVNDFNMLINLIECKPKLVNTAKSGYQVKVNMKGSVRVLARNNFDQKVSINVPNVFYCPDLASNLLSIKQIINSGADVVELLWGRIELERDECLKGCLSLVAGRVMLTRIRVWTLKE